MIDYTKTSHNNIVCISYNPNTLDDVVLGSFTREDDSPNAPWWFVPYNAKTYICRRQLSLLGEKLGEVNMLGELYD